MESKDMGNRSDDRQALVLAAGLGTRLRPWTLKHPKALVPVGGVPMLRRVMDNLKKFGFGNVVVNVHHYSDQIIEFLADDMAKGYAAISDESELLLDTGGAVVKAMSVFSPEKGAVLVHNVDILSDADLCGLMDDHIKNRQDAVSLLVSDRDSSRKLLFDSTSTLRGWHNLKSGEYRHVGVSHLGEVKELAFSGIYAIGFGAMEEMRKLYGEGTPFSVIDYFLDSRREMEVKAHESNGLDLIDIGKPETLSRANARFF